MSSSLKLFILLALSSSVSAFAHSKRDGANGSVSSAAVNCMATALAGESNGTASSMEAVARTINRRVQLGEGNICAVVYAPGQFVGVRIARRKPTQWRSLAHKVAQKAVAQKLVHPYRQFRTAGMTSHRGAFKGGNIFFDTGKGGGGGSSLRYAGSRRHQFARRGNSRYYAEFNNDGSFFSGFGEGTR